MATEIDYANTVIYKIVCLDEDVKDLYIGSTCDFANRRSKHKSACNNPNDKAYNLKVYSFIRMNGGWQNWNMLIVEHFPCDNKVQKLERERYWIERLGGTLNCQLPNRSDKESSANYRKNNSDKRKEYATDYRKTNSEKINKKHICCCGGCYTNANKARHLQAIQHNKWYRTTNEYRYQKIMQVHDQIISYTQHNQYRDAV